MTATFLDLTRGQVQRGKNRRTIRDNRRVLTGFTVGAVQFEKEMMRAGKKVKYKKPKTLLEAQNVNAMNNPNLASIRIRERAASDLNREGFLDTPAGRNYMIKKRIDEAVPFRNFDTTPFSQLSLQNKFPEYFGGTGPMMGKFQVKDGNISAIFGPSPFQPEPRTFDDEIANLDENDEVVTDFDAVGEGVGQGIIMATEGAKKVVQDAAEGVSSAVEGAMEGVTQMGKSAMETAAKIPGAAMELGKTMAEATGFTEESKPKKEIAETDDEEGYETATEEGVASHRGPAGIKIPPPTPQFTFGGGGSSEETEVEEDPFGPGPRRPPPGRGMPELSDEEMDADTSQPETETETEEEKEDIIDEDPLLPARVVSALTRKETEITSKRVNASLDDIMAKKGLRSRQAAMSSLVTAMISKAVANFLKGNKLPSKKRIAIRKELTSLPEPDRGNMSLGDLYLMVKEKVREAATTRRQGAGQLSPTESDSNGGAAASGDVEGGSNPSETPAKKNPTVRVKSVKKTRRKKGST